MSVVGKPLVEFLAAEAAFIMVGFAVAAQLAPPDLDSQILGTLVILTVTLPLSYWLVYRRGR